MKKGNTIEVNKTLFYTLIIILVLLIISLIILTLLYQSTEPSLAAPLQVLIAQALDPCPEKFNECVRLTQDCAGSGNNIICRDRDVCWNSYYAGLC